MMKLLILCSLLIASVFSKCGKVQKGVPALGIMTSKDKYADSNGKFFAAVFTGGPKTGRWSPWRKIDNVNCDDFEQGEINYFNDFAAVKRRWEAVAFYACTNDGLILETVGAWNGAGGMSLIHVWEEGVFGPFGKKCLYNALPRKDPQTGNTVYSDILIDGDSEGCDGVVFDTRGAKGDIWTGRLPTIPNCAAREISRSSGMTDLLSYDKPAGPQTGTNSYTAFEQQLLNYLMAVVGIALLLFVSNSCLMAYAIKNKNGGSSGGYYGKVAQTDIE